MTVGEKIQYYRKKTGLSQEELGQKLFVSRQTISLWEMDKTLPTVDNLMRLKDIFSVSIDDILSETEPSEAKAEAKPDVGEAYTFEYTKEDMRSISKGILRPLCLKFALLVWLFAMLLVFFVTFEVSGIAMGILLGAFLVSVALFTLLLVRSAKNWKANEQRVAGSEYHYEIFDKYFVVNVVKGGEVIKNVKIYFEEIEKINAIGKFWILEHRAQGYIVDKDALRTDSPLRAFLEKRPDKIKIKEKKGPLEKAATVLFILTLVSLFGAMICMSILSEINHAFIGNAWVFFLLTPITISSIVLGVVLKKKGKKYKKNIIAGIVMTVSLCMYGSFTFIFAGLYTHDEAPILRVERLLHIDIPEYEYINTLDWSQGIQSSRSTTYLMSEVYFKEEAVKEFEQGLPYDYKWMKGAIPSDLVGITSFFSDSRNYDYSIIYNVNTGEFNTLPSRSGRFRFINVMYNCKSNEMTIVEYEIDYVKQGNAASVPFLLFARF